MVLRLTHHGYNKLIYVNFQYVIKFELVTDGGTGSYLYMSNGMFIVVDESPDLVFQMLQLK